MEHNHIGKCRLWRTKVSIIAANESVVAVDTSNSSMRDSNTNYVHREREIPVLMVICKLIQFDKWLQILVHMRKHSGVLLHVTLLWGNTYAQLHTRTKQTLIKQCRLYIRLFLV